MYHLMLSLKCEKIKHFEPDVEVLRKLQFEGFWIYQ